MKIVAILLIIGVLVFLAIIGVQIYKTLCMKFIFDNQSLDEDTEPVHTKKPRALEPFNIQSKRERNESLRTDFADQL